MLVCDYLKFTFKPERLPYAERERITKRLEARHNPDIDFRLTDFDFFMEVFPEIKAHLDDFIVVESARYYKRRHCFNDSCYIYDDDGFGGSKGVNVEFPSHGLHLIKEWFNLNDLDIISSFGSIILCRGCTVSRLDVCVDIPIDKCTVKPIDFLYWASNGQLKSHYRCLQACGSRSQDFIIKTLMGGDGGATFYLGSRRHQILRVYDKNVESKGENPSIRYEIETHREKAQDILVQYLEHRFDFKALLLSMLDIVKYYDSNNRSRVDRDEKFEAFLSSCLTNCAEEEMFVPSKKVPPSILQKQAWALRIIHSIQELEYIDPAFRMQLDMVRQDFEPSSTAEKLKVYINSIRKGV